MLEDELPARVAASFERRGTQKHASSGVLAVAVIDQVFVVDALRRRTLESQISLEGDETTSVQVEPVEVHDLHPRLDEVLHEPVLAVGGRVDLRHGSQF